MKSAFALIGTGLTIVLISLLTWTLTGGFDAAGDAAAVEAALTSPAPSAAAGRMPTTTVPADEPDTVTPSPEPAPPAAEQFAIPQFTIGQEPGGMARVPVAIEIPALDQDAPIKPAGVAANGDMEVPHNVTDVAWYKYGPAPGEAGSAVLAAHVDLAGQGPGVFFELRDLDLGSEIVIEFDDGTEEIYVAEARTIYDKDDLPTEAIFSREGPPVLTLITCGGGFNEQIRRYDSNVVVYAVPATFIERTI